MIIEKLCSSTQCRHMVGIYGIWKDWLVIVCFTIIFIIIIIFTIIIVPIIINLTSFSSPQREVKGWAGYIRRHIRGLNPWLNGRAALYQTGQVSIIHDDRHHRHHDKKVWYQLWFNERTACSHINLIIIIVIVTIHIVIFQWWWLPTPTIMFLWIACAWYGPWVNAGNTASVFNHNILKNKVIHAIWWYIW